MAEEKKETTEYRARPLPQQSTLERVQTLPVDKRVVVQVLPWYKSETVLINGALLIGSTLLQIGDVIFGANMLEPLVGIFFKEPETASKAILIITQIYTVLGLYLRATSTRPITLNTKPKE